MGGARVNPFVEAAYAAARLQLRLARQAQQNAVLFGMSMYRGGRLGANSRFQRGRADALRSAYLAEALRIRANIRKLRELARAA